MQWRGRYHALSKGRTMLLRCESREPPMSQMGQQRRIRPACNISASPSAADVGADIPKQALSAKSRLMQCKKSHRYAITSSARVVEAVPAPLRVINFSLILLLTR